MSIEKQYNCPYCEDIHDSQKHAIECCLQVRYVCPICGENWDDEGSAVLCCSETMIPVFKCSECESIFHDEPNDGLCPLCKENENQ